jgi:GAF domain-containing protein
LVSAEALRVDSATHGFADTLGEIDRHLDVASATAKLEGNQPFRGAGRRDDDLERALKAIAETMGVPLATVNLLDDERHRDDEGAYKLTEIISARKEPLIIPPGIEGEELSDNPYLQTNGVDFYAGVPLTLETGLTVGSLVILDYEEHPFGEDELARLQRMAAELVERFGNASVRTPG